MSFLVILFFSALLKILLKIIYIQDVQYVYMYTFIHTKWLPPSNSLVHLSLICCYYFCAGMYSRRTFQNLPFNKHQRYRMLFLKFIIIMIIIIIILVYVSVCVVCRHVYRGQRITFGSWLFSSTVDSGYRTQVIKLARHMLLSTKTS